MLKLKRYAAALLVLLFCIPALAGDRHKPAQDSKPATQDKKEITPEDVPRISVDELILLMAKKAVLVLDVRAKGSYSEKILGAVQIPYDEIEARMKEIPHNKEIVTYCS